MGSRILTITLCVAIFSLMVSLSGIDESFASSHKIDICHLPTGNTANPQTLNIAIAALAVHVPNHGTDSLGQCPTITVTKIVSGGALGVSDFPLSLDNSFELVTSGTTEEVLTNVVYTASETCSGTALQCAGYTESFSGDCDSSGVFPITIGTLTSSSSYTCTITNTFSSLQTPSIVVTKIVDGGPLGVDDFPLSLDNGIGIVASGDATIVDPNGIVYTASETCNGTALQCAAYTAAFTGECNTSGEFPGTFLTDIFTCTITNTFNPSASITVTKIVDGGPLGVDDFPLSLDNDIGLIASGVEKAVDPASIIYITSETCNGTPIECDAYTASFSGNCDANGVFPATTDSSTFTCTITNTFTPSATITVTKIVDGGPLGVDDFLLSVNNDIGIVTSGVVTAVTFPFFYTASETCLGTVPQCDPYVATFSGDCDSSGVFIPKTDSSDYACTITNTFTPNPPTSTIEHFLAYNIYETDKQKFKKQYVGLSDYFGAGEYRVDKLYRLYNPVDKNSEGLTDIITHYVGYKIKQQKGYEKSDVDNTILVQDQFGSLSLDVKNPRLLLVPSTKDHSNTPAMPTYDSADHFKCYDVRETKNTPKFQDITVSVFDPNFGETIQHEVDKPKWFCNPVLKTHDQYVGQILNAEGSLTCYDVDNVKGEPRHKRTSVYTNNQFGPEGLKTKKVEELCVPSVIVSNGMTKIDPPNGPMTCPTGNSISSPLCGSDLSINKSDNVDPSVAGDQLEYTITVNNAGPESAQNVIVTDTLPAGVTFVATTGCAEDPVGVPTCSLGIIAANDSAQFTITVAIDSITEGTISNTATVSSDTADPDNTNNSASESTTVNLPTIVISPIGASITVTKIVDGGPLGVDDFPLSLDNLIGAVASGDSTMVNPNGIVYTASETCNGTVLQCDAYDPSFSGDCDGFGVFPATTGSSVFTCTITNTFTPDPPTSTIEHFLAYNIYETDKQKFKKQYVGLSDYFGAGEFRVDKLYRLYNPVDKEGEGLTDTITHYVGYKIKQQKGYEKSGVNYQIDVKNQFGSLSLDVKNPRLLLVPSTKDHSNTPTMPTYDSADHFKCYDVRETKNTPKFKDRIVSVYDPNFGETIQHEVDKPKWFCNPVLKTHDQYVGQILNAEASLLCYDVDNVKGEPRHKRTSVYTNNQFGPEGLKTKKVEELCVPSAFHASGLIQIYPPK